MPQDFSHQNLRGHSFKGQDLTGANFSHSDIRGANFTNAILRNAKFINAKAGLKRYWAVGLLLGSILLAALSGFTSAYIGGIAGIGFISDRQPEGIFFSVANLITLATFYIVTIRKGLIAALETIFWATALIATVYTAAALVVAIAVVVTAAEPSAVEQAWTRVGTIGGSVVTVGAMVLYLASVVISFAAGSLAVAVAWTVAGRGRTVVAVGAAVGATVGGAMIALPVLTLVKFMATKPSDLMPVVLALVGTVTSTLAMARLSANVSRRFLAGDEKQAFVWKIALALAAMGGTKFQGADLTDADFTQAKLKNTDFRKANLTRTCWFQAQRLDHVHLGSRK